MDDQIKVRKEQGLQAVLGFADAGEAGDLFDGRRVDGHGLNISRVGSKVQGLLA